MSSPRIICSVKFLHPITTRGWERQEGRKTSAMARKAGAMVKAVLRDRESLRESRVINEAFTKYASSKESRQRRIMMAMATGIIGGDFHRCQQIAVLENIRIPLQPLTVGNPYAPDSG